MRTWLAATVLLLGAAAAPAVQRCDPGARRTSPAERFIVNEDGTVTDRVTRLTWARCPVGQPWDGRTCQPGKPYAVWFSWREAQEAAAEARLAGHADWRLPNIQELESIVERACVEPAVNTEVFPGTLPNAIFWSAGEDPENDGYAWAVDMADGATKSVLKDSVTFQVRLVRGRPLVFHRSEAGGDEAPADDGIHDPTNPDLGLLQRPEEAFAPLPKDRTGAPDWAAALRQGVIRPRAALTDGEAVEVRDDVILMKDTRQMPWVAFPHDIHSRWLACANCHDAIFVARKGANDLRMDEILRGEQCGRCHGKVAFSPFVCERCHSVPHEGSPRPWW
ncbi:DUF1566 domain-containing protein [Inmirania thermothiophila]|uniref:Lcl domain-containing protein n=1 Tax=Inmirania thermothiophila TaxID=1750597 RepID=UPI001475D6C0|nr:DUF1566 domain-containing protein [Inmirania thermothiophila]